MIKKLRIEVHIGERSNKVEAEGEITASERMDLLEYMLGDRSFPDEEVYEAYHRAAQNRN